MDNKRQSTYTADQLVIAWRLWKEGTLSYKEVAEQSGIKPNSIYMILADLARYVEQGKKIGKTMTPEWKNAVLILLDQEPEVEEKTEEDSKEKEEKAPVVAKRAPVKETDNVKRLEDAFAEFELTIVDIILDEAKQQAKTEVQAVLAKKEAEFIELQNKHEQELAQLKETMSKEKSSNPMDRIRKAWGK